MSDKNFKQLMEEKMKQAAHKRALEILSLDERPIEQREFLIEQGWTCIIRKMKLLEDKPSINMEFWYHKDNNQVGHSIYSAIRVAVAKQETEQRKEEKKKYKMEIMCNKCGESTLHINGDIPMGYYGLIDAEVHGGFESDPLEDGLIYRFSLCEKCLYELFQSFKNVPDITMYM